MGSVVQLTIIFDVNLKIFQLVMIIFLTLTTFTEKNMIQIIAIPKRSHQH